MSRVAALVLGAHRSGTSVTTGLLARLGFALPRTLMPADSWNPKGYFESSRLHVFHDRMLLAAGTGWDAYTRVDPGWLESDEAVAMREECRDLLRSEYGDAPRFVVKDPRICRFVPFWLRVLADERIQPKAVLVVRPPLDVAGSLRARDGMPLALGALVWLRHVLDADVATRAIPRTWAPYADTLHDWRDAVRRMGVDLGEEWLIQAASAGQGDGLVNRALQHHQGPLETSDLPDLLVGWIRRTEEALSHLYAGDASLRRQAEPLLDAVRVEFDRITATVGAADEPRYRESVETANAWRAAAHRSTSERDDLQAGLNRVLAERNHMETERDEIARQMERLMAALEASRFEVEALRRSMSWRVTAPLRAVYRFVRQPAAD